MKTEYADIGIEALALVIAEKYEWYLVANDFLDSVLSLNLIHIAKIH